MITFKGFATSESLFICFIFKIMTLHPNIQILLRLNLDSLQNLISSIIVLISSSEYTKDGCFGLIITLIGIFNIENALLIKSL